METCRASVVSSALAGSSAACIVLTLRKNNTEVGSKPKPPSHKQHRVFPFSPYVLLGLFRQRLVEVSSNLEERVGCCCRCCCLPLLLLLLWLLLLLLLSCRCYCGFGPLTTCEREWQGS